MSVSTIVKLADAWGLGTKIYSNPKINITFDYPSYFNIKETDVVKENADWQAKYKNNSEVRQPLYKSSFYVSFSTPDIYPIEDKSVTTYCDNRMSVSVQRYENSQSLSLYDFIADLNKTFPGNGIIDTFDTYKRGLKPTNTPKENSYVFEGIVGENPVRTVYFTNKSEVYTFGLIGNCNTGGQYTPDADKVFQNILRTIKFQ